MMTTKFKKMAARPLSIAALATVAAALPACGDLQNNTIPVELISYMPGGSLVLFTMAGIYVYDGRLQTEINHIPLDALATPPFDVEAEFMFSISADGTVGAVSYSLTGTNAPNSQVAIYGIPDGHLLNLFELADATPPPYGHGVVKLALSPDGTLLFALTGGDRERARVVDTATGAPLWTQDSGTILQPVWSADGTTLFTAPEAFNVTSSTLNALDARTGTVKWTAQAPDGMFIGGLQLVGNGAAVTGPEEGVWVGMPPCTNPGDCPPVYPFWSTTDGSLTMQLLPVAHTMTTGSNPHGEAHFACNGAYTCALGLSEFTPIDPPPTNSSPWVQSSFIRVYNTAGTTLLTLSMDDGAPLFNYTQGAMAISPDGKFFTIAPTYGLSGSVTTFSIDDGSVVGSHAFTTETF